MWIDERGREQQAVGVNHAVGVGLEVRAECRDDAVVDADVGNRVDALCPIEDACTADDQVLAGRVLGEQHHATSTGSPTGTGTGAPTSRS